MKFNRRLLLLTGLGAGISISGAREQARINKILAQQQSVGGEFSDRLNIMDAAYASELAWDEEVERRKELLAAVSPAQPTVPYNRKMSKRLIQLCKLAVQQFKTGRAIPTYDGSIKLLPDYQDSLDAYTQLTNFTAQQDSIEDYFSDANSQLAADNPATSTAIGQTLEEVELTLRDKARQILQRQHRVAVYSGIALSAPDHNVLVFRGTQTQAEWLKNIQARQVDYVSPSGQSYGAVHKGFLELMRELQPSIPEVARQLDPTLPCYVTGHSLGAAIATLVAFEIVRAFPQFKDRVRLYTFAGPRVASPIFAKFHGQLVPDTYRIVNAGDTIPLIPPVTMGSSYTHVGQEWSFLAQLGDTLLNHVVDTYQAALEREVETERSLAAMQSLGF